MRRINGGPRAFGRVPALGRLAMAAPVRRLGGWTQAADRSRRRRTGPRSADDRCRRAGARRGSARRFARATASCRTPAIAQVRRRWSASRWRRTARGPTCRGRSSCSTPTASTRFAAPGGYVHITRGALALMKNEAELAGVLGHEIIHVTEKHTIRAIQKSKAIQMGANETMANNPALFNKTVDKATDVVDGGFGRAEELEADEKGIVVADEGRLRPERPRRVPDHARRSQQELDWQAGSLRLASRDGRAAEETGQDHRRSEADRIRRARRAAPSERHLQARAAGVRHDG